MSNDHVDQAECYYSILGIRKQASATEIRDAYRKLALKWHPDRRMREESGGHEAKRKFQRVQEAYSVLSDQSKRSIYDAGMFSLLSGEDDDQGFCDFILEMVMMMENVRSQENSLEDLQRSFMDMIGEEERLKLGLDWQSHPRKSTKRTRFF